jgi:diguanylate cyclase (GGDEF)-like protein/PAS domain S-box-containing protein
MHNAQVPKIRLIQARARASKELFEGTLPVKQQQKSSAPLEESLSKAVLDNLGDAVSVVVGTTRVYVNDAYLGLYGLKKRSEAVGRRIDENVSEDQRSTVVSRALAMQRGELPKGNLFEYRIKRRNGEERIVQVRAMAVEYLGQPASLSIQRDVTERVRAERRLKEAVSLNAATLESTADGILVIDLQGTVVSFNRRFAEMWGLKPRSLRKADPPQVKFKPVVDQLRDETVFIDRIREVHADPGVATLDVLELRDGRVFERYSLPHKLGDSVIGRVWSFRDVTAQRRLEEELRYQANHDPLTDLLNRRGLAQFVAEKFQTAGESCPPGALLLLDLDQFKDVNDTLGHLAGDDILCEVVDLLRARLPENSAMARLGGDEFALVICDVSPRRIVEVAESLLTVLQQHVFEADSLHKLGLTASVGIALAPAHGRTFEQLLSSADVALYRSKAEGRNRATIYEPKDQHGVRSAARLRMRYNIHEALENDRLVLYAQPIVRLRDGKVSRYELLLRMVLPDGEVLEAASFIPLAELSGLIRSIDSRVVEKSIAVAARLAGTGSDFKLEVNLSGSALTNKALLAQIKQGIRDYEIDPARLIFEVTETAAVSNLPAAQRFVRELKDAGCGFALDDFGVGFSSLAELKNLPVDYLKIDGSFITNLETSIVDQKLVGAMVAVAEALGMGTIAEFAGSAEAVECLKRLGVGYAQGYHFGKARDVEEIVRSWSSRESAA